MPVRVRMKKIVTVEEFAGSVFVDLEERTTWGKETAVEGEVGMDEWRWARKKRRRAKQRKKKVSFRQREIEAAASGERRRNRVRT